MAKSREINMNLPSADDLFTTQEERDHKNQEYVKDISIYEITDFPNHPFKVKMDDKMLETIDAKKFSVRFSRRPIEVRQKLNRVLIVKRGSKARMLKALLPCIQLFIRLPTAERKLFSVK